MPPLVRMLTLLMGQMLMLAVGATLLVLMPMLVLRPVPNLLVAPFPMVLEPLRPRLLALSPVLQVVGSLPIASVLVLLMAPVSVLLAVSLSMRCVALIILMPLLMSRLLYALISGLEPIPLLLVALIPRL